MCIFHNGRKFVCVSYGIYIRLSHSLTSDTLTPASLAVLMFARMLCRRSLCWLTGAVAALCFSLCETGERRAGQTASQLATASPEPDMSLLNPIANTLQCSWISWKPKVGRLPKINRHILFLLPLLFPPKTFQVLFEAEELMSSLSHCLLFASRRLSLSYNFPVQGDPCGFPSWKGAGGKNLDSKQKC